MYHLANITLRLAVVLLFATGAAVWGEDATRLRVATFRSDVTPPPGHPLTGGFNNPVKTVEDRLEAKGVVLIDGSARYVICAMDWCGLANSSYWLVRRKIADAAGTDISHVAVQCLHQHTAPLVDGDGQELMESTKNPIPMFDIAFLRQVADRIAAAVEKSLDALQPFDQIGTGSAKVERVASSRRIPIAGGKVRSRMSSTKDPELQALPEGTIDPILKTITLAHGNKPLVRMHYYATHPQSFYGDGRVCSDVPGFARKELEKKQNVFQIYFTGCGGDVAMGKYNDGTPRARSELTGRLLAGMEAAAASTRFVPARRLTWRTVPLRLPLRNEGRFTVAKMRTVMQNPKTRSAARIDAATYLAFANRIERPILLTSLQIGNVHIVHLPGEPMVEYQLYAQRVLHDRFVAVAGYGEYDPIYICTRRAFSEGGYEPTEAWSAPHSEAVLKKAVRQLLGIE